MTISGGAPRGGIEPHLSTPPEKGLQAGSLHRLDRELGCELGELRVDEGRIELYQDVARIDDASFLDRDPLHLARLERPDRLDQPYGHDASRSRRRDLDLRDCGPHDGCQEEGGEQAYQEKLGTDGRRRHHGLPAPPAADGMATGAVGPVTKPSASTGVSSTIREK